MNGKGETPKGVRFGSNVRIHAIPRTVYGFVGNAMSVIAGRSGASKSTLAATMAAEVTAGGGVVLASMKEDADFIFTARVQAAGGDTSKLALAADADWMFPRDIPALEQAIVDTEAQLVILDTAAKHFLVPVSSPKAVEPSKALDQLARRLNVPIILVTHTIKSVSKNGEPLDAIGGSTGGLVGSARTVMIFGKCAKDPSNPDAPQQRAAVMAKDSYAAEGTIILFDLDSEEIEDDVTGEKVDAAYLQVADPDLQVADPRAYAMELIVGGVEGKRGPGQSSRLDAAEWLTQLLALGPCPVNTYTDPQHGEVEGIKEQAKANGLSWASVRRAKDECNIEATKQGYQGKWFWQLPAGHPALAGSVTP